VGDVGLKSPLISMAITLSLSVFPAAAGDLPVESVGQSGQTCNTVAVSASRAYVGSGARLLVLDISEPSTPTLLGQSQILPGDIKDLAVKGRYVYAAADTAGLQVFDINDPANPFRIGYLSIGGTACGIAVSGNYAYIANWDVGLQIINISDPCKPVSAGTYELGNGSYGVAVSGRFAYIAYGSNGLEIIDVNNPASPVWAGAYNTSGTAKGVAVSGRYAYVADWTSGLQIIDVNNPADPDHVGWCDTDGALDVAVSGRYAFVADGITGLQIIDIFYPDAPVRLCVYNTNGQAVGVAASGSSVYVADSGGGLVVLRVGRPGDFEPDGDVDLDDIAFFARHWLQTGCSPPEGCEGTDLDSSGIVNFEDFNVLADNWMKGL
jgi:hypothetical protein